jgi:enediyne biosynthesis protein E4
VLLRNEGIDGDGLPHFSDVGMATGADDIKDGRGVAVADFDNDGALDLAVSNNPGDSGQETVPATLLHNNVGTRRNWLAVELEGLRCNRDAIGAVVTAEFNGCGCGTRPGMARMMRHVAAGSGYASQHGARLYFGLDDREQVDTLKVRGEGGGTETFTNVKAGQLVRITEGRGIEYRTLPRKGGPPAESRTKAGG